ncbi:hypothetical protein Tco_1223126 [Tanacetum coccineum]
MEGYTLKQLKGFKFEVIKDMFDKAFKRVNTFVDYKTELVEGSEKRAKDKSPVWRTLQNEKVLIWKLFDSCRVHFLRLQSMHIFMLVEKRYPLTPVTITCMINKKLQDDHWNETCYQLLKLITKQLKNPRSGRIVGIKSFIRLFGIIAALIKVSATQEERVNAAGTELQLLMDKD